MLKKYQAILKLIVMLAGVMIIFKLCLIFLWPFLIAIILSFILEPLVKMFCSLGLPRKLSVGISIFLAVLVILLFGVYISNFMYNQIVGLSKNLSSILTVLGKRFGFLDQDNISYTSIIKTLENVIMPYKNKIFETLITTFNGFLYTIIIFMSTVFISIDLENLVKIIKKNVSSKIFNVISNVCTKAGKIIKVEMQLIFITTLQTVIGLYILGVNSALTIGIICGILDLLPIVGPAVVFVPLIIYEFLVNQIFVGTGLIILFVLLQVSREVMKVKFVGQNLKIHPITTIISLYFGIMLYGLWGLILGPLIIILVMELVNNFYGGSRFFKL